MPANADTGYSTHSAHRRMRRFNALGWSRLKYLVLISLCLAAAIDAGAEEVISLALPIKCQPGLTCFFQNYVDHDASDKVRDYRCGGRSYDGHDGTDIRIRNLEIQRQGVEVLAAAPGRVIGGRNDMEDISVKTAGKAAIAGKECGNGVLIEHEGGWRTQYCHMAKGSVRVKVGDQMTTGQPIGLVGLSGDTEFFHLHFTVRHRGKIVDPFAYGAPENSCGGGRSIWAASLGEQMQYRPGEIIDYGFAGIAPTMELIESGEIGKHPVTPGFGCARRLCQGHRPAGRRPAIPRGARPGRRSVSDQQPSRARPGQGAVPRHRRKEAHRGRVACRPLHRDVPCDQRRRGSVAKDFRH